MKIYHFTIVMVLFGISIGLAQGKLDILYLKNGNILKGVIVENVPNDYVRIELPGGSLITVKYSEITKLSEESPAKIETIIEQTKDVVLMNRNSIGLGFGNPYGFFGLNIDHTVFLNLDGSIGLGQIGLKKIAINIGGKYYFLFTQSDLRTRFSIYYGVNNGFTKYVSSEKTETEVIIDYGFTFALGLQWMFGQNKSHGFDFDICLPTSSQSYRNEFVESMDNDLLKSFPAPFISLGYRYAF